MGSAIVQNIILLGGLVVQIVTLLYLIKYVRATKGIEESANKQTEVSQGLLKAANDQTEASQELMAVANAQARSSEIMARWQPEQWRRDSRGQEWRELVGALTASVSKIEAGPPPHPFAPRPGGAPLVDQLTEMMNEQFSIHKEFSHWLNDALLGAARVLSDRLFITDVLEREHIREEWREVELLSHGLPLYQQSDAASNGGLCDRYGLSAKVGVSASEAHRTGSTGPRSRRSCD
jgi:hypothetical protein